MIDFSLTEIAAPVSYKERGFSIGHLVKVRRQDFIVSNYDAMLALFAKLSQNLFMENIPRSETPEYIDVLASLADHTDFMQQIASTEEVARQIDPSVHYLINPSRSWTNYLISTATKCQQHSAASPIK